jgi:DNA primase
MKHEGMDFRESLEHLARRVGIPLPEREQTPAEKRRRRQADRLRKVLALAARYFQYVLWQTDKGSAACEYLNDRGFSEDIVKSFQLGYAPDAWGALLNALTKRGHSPQLLERAGLVSPRQEGTGHYDRFRNRLMFTICDHRGRVVGFGGRTLGDEQPKYLNSPETPVFGKRKLWYGLHRAKQAVRRKEQALVMEGYTDVLAAHQFGFEQAVASLGTALSPEQAKQLARFAPEVVIAYDADTAGGAATARGLELFENSGSRVKVIRMPDGADPDDVLREEGRQGFARLLQEARPLV